jgi:hypothetical protein
MTIAFCFLTYSDLDNSMIWMNYLKKHLDKINIYIHAKYPIKHHFFKKYICKKIIQTRRKEDISIVHATLSILREAFLNKNNTHFIFLCQSSIPLVSFGHLKEIILNSKKSFIKTFLNNCTFRYYQLHNIFKSKYGYNMFVKQHPNMILVRKHVSLFMNYIYLSEFKNMTCPDEHYFINILKLHGQLNEIENRQIVFCNYNINRTQGIEHKKLMFNDILKIISRGYLFIRKINSNTAIHSYYYDYIYK